MYRWLAAASHTRERCFAGWSDGRIVTDCWAVAGQVSLEAFGRLVLLAPDQLWFGDSFVTPQLRGRNIATLRAALMTTQLSGEGYRRIVYHVAPRNVSALAAPRKMGAHRLGYLGHVRLGPLRLFFDRVGGGSLRLTLRMPQEPRLLPLALG